MTKMLSLTVGEDPIHGGRDGVHLPPSIPISGFKLRDRDDAWVRASTNSSDESGEP
ncbi:MAG TPA: hypothetical protein VK720_04960 [Terracidiphilus sp.]|jgi:hypothetical protein|nr:hypothetical protein [Terracidiphilus sp.]